MFYYVEKFQAPSDHTKVVTINDTIVGKKELLHFYSVTLRFPYTTVTNFDAFRDVMGELDWLQEEEIVIFHDKLPLLDKQDMASYIDYLNLIDVEWEKSPERAEIVREYLENQGQGIPLDAWINQPPKTFNVYFHLKDKAFIEKIIKQYSKDYRKYIKYDERGKPAHINIRF